ncbi:MAG: hypothetical protein WD875_10215 [Pirellulales bacterium]
MKRALMAALLAAALGTTTGCGVLDTVLLGRPCADGRGPCGSTCDACAYGGGHSGGGDFGCGDACGGDSCEGGCGSCGGCCHDCPLFEILGKLHPDRLLCICEYRGCDGCGERYWGDWYQGQRAGCESCDCHGNYAGPGYENYSPRSGRVIEERVVEPTPADAAPKPSVSPGPEQGASSRRGTSTRRTAVVPTRATKAKQPVTHLRPVENDPQWTARRER